MWLKTPESLDKVLWEGALELSSLEARSTPWGPPRLGPSSLEELPVVSIGAPESWRLQDFYPLEAMPLSMRKKLVEAEFYLIRLAFSLRPPQGQRVKWASLQVHLLADDAGHQPIAFDMHPLLVTRETRHNLKVTLSPTLKFQELEASVGGYEHGMEYTTLEPIISAAGMGEAIPSWDYTAYKDSPLQGVKFMYLLLKAPKGMRVGRARLLLEAAVVREGVVLWTLWGKQATQAPSQLEARLWGSG